MNVEFYPLNKIISQVFSIGIEVNEMRIHVVDNYSRDLVNLLLLPCC